VPIYICASASTPIAAALLLKGASPGAVLVFLLAGPATNIASLTMLKGLLGRRATLIYLAAIIAGSLLSGLAVNIFYSMSGFTPTALVAETTDITPLTIKISGALVLLALSIAPMTKRLKALFKGQKPQSCDCGHCHH